MAAIAQTRLRLRSALRYGVVLLALRFCSALRCGVVLLALRFCSALRCGVVLLALRLLLRAPLWHGLPTMPLLRPKVSNAW